jgi:LacI family transcriptional regulator
MAGDRFRAHREGGPGSFHLTKPEQEALAVATIRDVAKRAGVSAGTVSNVINRPSYVGLDTRKRVLDVIAELDFEPRKSAQQFRRGRERTLGLSIAQMRSPFFVDVAVAADAEAKRLGMGVVLVLAEDDARREEHNLDLLVQQRVHGIIITPVDELNPRLEQLIDRGVPIVYVDRISGNRPCCWVTTDDAAGGRLAGEHLIERGHRRLGFVGGSGFSEHVGRRFEGFEAASVEAGTSILRVDTDSWMLEDGVRAANVIADLSSDARPTAVMCANDLLALGLLQGLWKRGIHAPDDIAIVGFDDLEWASASVVPISSVHQKRDELGRLAVQMLVDEITNGDEHVHRHVVLQPELITRESSALRFER